MIILKDEFSEKEIKFEITKFPDGTTQTWKLDPEPKQYQEIEIFWMFEHESELITILQLQSLIKSVGAYGDLVVPFLPYGRQDKEISNTSTFARDSFLATVNDLYVVTFDSHSKHDKIRSLSPKNFHETVIPKDSTIVYPDYGAVYRYPYLRNKKFHNGEEFDNYVFFSKIRNQQTGEIEGLGLAGDPVQLEGQDVYIVDDICDYGNTFIKVTEVLKQYKPKSINLVVSHGLFSGGLEMIYNSGIDRIITTNSLLRNQPQTSDKFTVYKQFEITYPEITDEMKRYLRKMV